MSTEEQDWDLQAAEYVLGTLNDETRKVFDTLYQVDEDWQRRVHHWQARLDPLNALTQAVEPPGHILPAIMARLEETSDDALSPEADQPDNAALPAGDKHQQPGSALAAIRVWKERARYWRFATALAVASLVGILFLAPRYFEQRQQVDEAVRTVAVLQGESNSPLWAVVYHSNTEIDNTAAGSRGTISVTAVGDPQESAEQSHQLWMVLPEGAGVRSVGLVPGRQGETATFDLPITLAEAGEFAVSLEPLGGVPGPEHGPVVARTFIIEASE